MEFPTKKTGSSVFKKKTSDADQYAAAYKEVTAVVQYRVEVISSFVKVFIN